MSVQQRRAVAVGVAVVVVAVAYFLIGTRPGSGLGKLPGLGAPPACPLSGEKPRKDHLLDRPALAVKVENNPLAYPLSGVDKAEVVDEELVEGGLTRFMLFFHCTDANPVGPIRSSREIDPAIMEPITHILAAAGGNNQVRSVLDKLNVILIDERGAGGAMLRRDRPGKTSEHTLYGNTAKLRKIGEKKYSDPPPDDVFEFGKVPSSKSQKARTISINFSQVETIQYTYHDGKYLRSDYGHALTMENGKQLAPNNVLIEEHTYNLSNITDIAGAHSTHIADATGKGKAVLFRDGRAYFGTWSRDSMDSATTFELKNGDPMVLHPGQTVIELVPNDKGELKGSFDYDK